MTKLNPNHLVWAVAVMLTLGVPGSIVAWNLTSQPSVIVQPGPAPVVEVTFKDQVRAATAALTDEERAYALTQYAAMRAVCLLDKQPTDDGHYQQLLESVRKSYFGDPYPYKDSLKPLTEVSTAEAVKRGLLAANGDAVAWDREKWLAFAQDASGGLQ